MPTDLAIIHALECSLDAKKKCIGPVCPYFTDKDTCATAAKRDAINRLKNVAKVERKYKKGWDANDT